MTTAIFSYPQFRFVASLPVALATTLGLMLLMQTLISTNIEPPEEIKNIPMKFHLEERKITTKAKEPKPEKPVEPTTPPPQEVPVEVAKNTDQSTKVERHYTRGHSDIDPNIWGGTDGEYLPIVKVNPSYPSRALQRGIEGWVVVEFTVTKSGAVRDAIAVDAQPANIFNRAAIKAALKFKYKPRVIDGEAIEVAGVRNKITFAIAK